MIRGQQHNLVIHAAHDQPKAVEHINYSPSIRISARPLVGNNILQQGPIVVRMSGHCHRPRLVGRVSDECLLIGNGDVPPKSAGTQFGPVGLEPYLIAAGALILLTALSQLLG